MDLRTARVGQGAQGLPCILGTAVILPTIEAQSRRRQGGFTLVEIAIVLVIIGLLIGGILKAMEMVNSAHVRRLADLSSSVQVAYAGFLDRYRQVPGDWTAAGASAAIGVPITGNGNNNGRLDNPPDFFRWNESNALWEQLSKAGFISGNYLGTAFTEPTAGNSLAPLNEFGGVVLVGRTPDFEGAAAQVRLNVVLGRRIPVDIARELDVKVDDGVPDQGAVRATVDDGNGVLPSILYAQKWGGREAACVDATPVWDVTSESKDCNAISLF
jgi:prepilin-type N-terminal cleavage/methylation domain-containing protein